MLLDMDLLCPKFAYFAKICNLFRGNRLIYICGTGMVLWWCTFEPCCNFGARNEWVSGGHRELLYDRVVGVRQPGYKYEGDYNEKNQRSGHGHAEFHNGDIYDGLYENGKRHGHGVYTSVTTHNL